MMQSAERTLSALSAMPSALEQVSQTNLIPTNRGGKMEAQPKNIKLARLLLTVSTVLQEQTMTGLALISPGESSWQKKRPS
jgi:hypothetical protein